MDQPPSKKKDAFSLWTDSKDEGTRLDFKRGEQLSAALEAMAENEKRSIEDKLIHDFPGLGEVLRDPTLTPFKKKMAVLPLIKREKEHIREEQKTLDQKTAYCERFKWVVDAYEKWVLIGEPVLEPNDCSRLHQLVGALKLQKKIMPSVLKGGDPDDFPWKEVNPFVVQHDWAGAFKNAGDYAGGGFKLPFEKCAFEFRISGRPLTVLAMEREGQEPRLQFYAGFGDIWITVDDGDKEPPAYDFARAQVKAICVALEAEVATRHIERVSEKVNRQREVEGREPFFSYHIVNLNRRYRAANPSPGGGIMRGKVRLHFRRGHWRRFATFKTWVRWTLVGNPELGFIDKEYRL